MAHIDDKQFPHPLKAGSKFRLQLSGAYQPLGRVLRINRRAGVFWFKLFEKPGVVFGPWCFSTFAGPVKKWKIVMTHHSPDPERIAQINEEMSRRYYPNPIEGNHDRDDGVVITTGDQNYSDLPMVGQKLSRVKIGRAVAASRKRFQKYTPADRKRLEANARARIAEGAAERGSLKGRRFGHIV